jgi:hypothetical protein
MTKRIKKRQNAPEKIGIMLKFMFHFKVYDSTFSKLQPSNNKIKITNKKDDYCPFMPNSDVSFFK